MERLVTTLQAAQILGLSLQGVHYRIKNNQLKSIKKSGKTYVYISNQIEDKPQNKSQVKEIARKNPYEELIKVKNEQINLLEKSIKWMKKQYTSEIIRLEKNQKRVISVFNAQIELLQSAFNEMRSIYKPQIVNQTPQKKVKEKKKFISLMQFSLYLKNHDKSEEDIKLTILKALKRKDYRFVYNKKDKKLLILNEDFSDLI